MTIFVVNKIAYFFLYAHIIAKQLAIINHPQRMLCARVKCVLNSTASDDTRTAVSATGAAYLSA